MKSAAAKAVEPDVPDDGADQTGDGGEERSRTYRALVSVFDVEDVQGDIVDAGAFSATIAERGQARPVMWSHGYGPGDIIGVTTSIEETDEGLLVEWRPVDSHAADAVCELIDAGAITDYSFSAGVRGEERPDGDAGPVHLTDLDLIEVGPCLRGANPQARGLPVESAAGDAEKADSGADTMLAERVARARLALLGLAD